MSSFTFTSESVTEGHPDKMADQISDAVLDAILAEDPHGRVACETLLTTGLCVVAGEITTSAYVDIPKLAREVIDRWKPVAIILNKWDLTKPDLKLDDYLDYLEQELPGLGYAPIVRMSAIESDGIGAAMRMAINLFEQASHRESTGRLNAVMRAILAERGPSSALGNKAKILYVSQIATAPPTIAAVVNKPDLFEGQYAKYLLNQMREQLPFSEVPIKLLFSERKRLSMEELATRKRAGREGGDDEAIGD